jgi:hypothetical protein
MSNNVTQLGRDERTEPVHAVGEFVHYLLSEIVEATIDPTADAATISAEMDRLLGEAMSVELTVRELLDVAVTALKHLSEAGHR